MIDIPRIFTISESEHRIHNPFTPEKYATLGRALRMAPGTTILDLGSGSGEMLCSWARDHQIVGTGVDMSLLFSQQAAARAEELGVSDRVTFVHQMPADMSPASRAMLPPAWGPRGSAAGWQAQSSC